MPSFARELETTLHNALGEASKRRHEYATLEHLLIALVDDNHASQVMTACGVNRDELKSTVKGYLDNELGALNLSSKLNTTWDFMMYLKDLGYKACDAWVNENYEHLGVRNTMKLE